MRPPVRAVLADLDDTLFDHSHATRAALGVLSSEEPAFDGWSLDDLAARHRDALELMHQEVLAGRMSIEAARVERFRMLLAARPQAGAASVEVAPAALARRYREAYEAAWRPVPGAAPLVEALRRAGVLLVIVTNNVTSEQRLKLDRCGLSPYVDALVTSEDVGATKPDVQIFAAGLQAAGAAAGDAVMIGDSWATDVDGALGAGLRAVWLNRTGSRAPRDAARVTEIRSLEPLAETWRRIIGPAE